MRHDQLRHGSHGSTLCNVGRRSLTAEPRLLEEPRERRSSAAAAVWLGESNDHPAMSFWNSYGNEVN